jgi:hypothetical protein
VRSAREAVGAGSSAASSTPEEAAAGTLPRATRRGRRGGAPPDSAAAAQADEVEISDGRPHPRPTGAPPWAREEGGDDDDLHDVHSREASRGSRLGRNMA